MRKTTTLLLCSLIWLSTSTLNAFTVPAAKIVLPGDSNCDEAVNVLDVITTTNYILGNHPQPFCFENADVNGDGSVNAIDVIGTINIILSGGPVLTDGFYILGEVTPYTELHENGSFVQGINEMNQQPKPGMYEKYLPVLAGAEGFKIIQVENDQITEWGPASVEYIATNGEFDQPDIIFQKGFLGNTGVFTVPEDGFYHVIVDMPTNTFAIAPVPFWGMIGSSLPDGWSIDLVLPLQGDFNLNNLIYRAEDVHMNYGEFKFRYGGGWKLIIVNQIFNANTNFGGDLVGSLPNLTTTVIPGGMNYFVSHEVKGIFDVEFTWNPSEGLKSFLTRTGDLPPVPYPGAMYLTGDATAYGWTTPGTFDDAIMHKIAGGTFFDGVYWKIAHLSGGNGFKLSAANWSTPNIGFFEVDEFDPDGVPVFLHSDLNMSVAESKMYIIVLDLRDEMVKVSIKPAVVYGIGEAFGGWDPGVEANRFVVDDTAKTVTSPPLPANGNIRIYADHAWIPYWWSAEFNVYDGEIIYRGDGGGDQPPVPGTQGQVINLMFDDNTGTITSGATGQPCPGTPTITDIDGNVYNTVLIGDQCWMKENLKTTQYLNGTPIEYPGSNNSAWQNNTTGAYAWYDNDISWKDSYGALYNWHAVNNANGLCPTGWHIPSDAEWTQLVDYVVAQGFPNQEDNPNGAGNALKSCRQVNSPLGGDCNTTAHPRWEQHGTHHGFDEFGFSGLPGGYRYHDGTFLDIGYVGDWWSSTEYSSSNAWYRGMYFGYGSVYRVNYYKVRGYSIRCLRD